MTQRANILQELNEIGSTLVNVTSQNIYSVPAGYFEEFADQMLNRIKSPLLNEARKNPYTVPTGYFDGLEERLMQAVRKSADYQTANEELESFSPLLKGLRKETLYTVPQGYFENLEAEINKPKAKIITITHRKWFRLAAAAVIVGIIASAGLFLKQQKPIDPNNNPYEWVAKNMKKVGTDKINNFMNSSGIEQLSKEAPEKNDDIKDLMKDVSDKDIQQFLNETAVVQDNDDITSLN